MAGVAEDLKQQLEAEKEKNKQLQEEAEVLQVQHKLEVERQKCKQWQVAMDQIKEAKEHAETALQDTGKNAGVGCSLKGGLRKQSHEMALGSIHRTTQGTYHNYKREHKTGERKRRARGKGSTNQGTQRTTRRNNQQTG